MMLCVSVLALLSGCGGGGSGSAPVTVVSAASAAVSASAAEAPSLATPAVAAEAGSSTLPPPNFLGVNLGTVAYYSGDRQFMNLLTSSTWGESSKSGWPELPAAQLNARGEIATLQTGQRAARILTFTAAALSGEQSKIRCSWAGTGTVKVGGMRVAGSDKYSDGAVQLVMPAFKYGDWIWLEVSASSASDPIRDMDCREADADRKAVFAPEFLAGLKPFGILRFLDWEGVNANPANPQWNDRTQEGGLGQTTVAWEHMAKLAASLNADAWYNVPYDAQEDYVRKLGQLIHDLTPANRKVYVELGNEVWNTAFAATWQAKREGVAEGLDPKNEWGAGLLRYAEKSTWLMKIWTPIFADRPGQLVRTIATQNANSWAAEQVLGFKDTAKWVDALATAPYFGGSLADQPGLDAAAILPTVAAQARDVMSGPAQANANVAKRFGKRYIAYEAGQHLLDSANVERLRTINRSAAMTDIYRAYLTDWKSRFGDTMVLYNSVGGIGQYGAWGLREYAGQPVAQAPKYLAAVEFGR